MTRRCARAVPGLASAVLLALAPIALDAQVVVEIGDDIACSECAIEAGSPVALVAPADGLWFSSLSGVRVSRDSEGNFIAAPVEGEALIAVFGPDGTYRSSYGRIGGGPGEFATNMPLLIEVGEGDVLYAINRVHLHTLAPRAETTLDQVRMPVRVMGDAVVLRDGIAVEAMVRTESGVTTVQLLRPDGTIAESMGTTGTSNEPSGLGLRRVLGRSNDHMDVWSAPPNRYRITRYGPDGQPKTRIERTSGWFRANLAFRPGAPLQAPANPIVSGIHQDADGLLWVAVSRAPRSFSPLVPGLRPGARGEMPVSESVDFNRFLHTTVEVLDPVAGEVVARRDFDESVRFVRTPGHDVSVYSLRADALGSLECIVTPLRLRRE